MKGAVSPITDLKSEEAVKHEKTLPFLPKRLQK